jgi:hypothetical protein
MVSARPANFLAGDGFKIAAVAEENQGYKGHKIRQVVIVPLKR